MIKKINKILSSPFFWLLLFLLSSIIYFWPFLVHPAFNLIDDGVSLRVSNELLSGNFSSLVETGAGRLRPIYWIYFSFIYLISGTNPIGYWLAQAFVFSLTLFSIWYLIRDGLSGVFSKVFGFILLLLFFIPAVSENLYRLGTAEVRQMLFVIIFMIWMKKFINSTIPKWIGFFVFFLAIFTKETSIFLLPLFAVYLFPFLLKNFKKYKKFVCSLLFFSFATLVIYSLITAMKEVSSYTSSFAVSWPQIKFNILISRLAMKEVYYLLILLFSLSFLRFIFYLINMNVFKSKKENYIFLVLIKFWQDNSILIATLIGLFASLFFVFSWQHQLGRYYYPVYLFLFIYFFIEVDKSIKLFLESKSLLRIIIIFLPLLTIALSYLVVFQRVRPDFNEYLVLNKAVKRRWFGDYQNSYSIINKLIISDSDTIYTLIDDLEVVYELSLFANKLNFNENKIQSYSPNIQAADSYQYINLSANVVNDFLTEESDNKILVTTESRPANLDKSIFEKEVISNALLDQYSDRSNWVIWRKK